MILVRRFDERNFNPNLGKGPSSTMILREYLKDKDANDYFISFTTLDKIGINPESGYDTPIGIYSYPLVEFFEKYKPMDKYRIGIVAPFAGDAPYVNLIKVDRKKGIFVDDLKGYSTKNLNKDINWLIDNRPRKIFLSLSNRDQKEFTDGLKKQGISIIEFSRASIHDPRKFSEYLRIGDIDSVFRAWGDEALFPNFPAGRMWNITRLVAEGMAKEGGGKNHIQWTKLFREMGYIGFADRSGIGIIHENEPFQALFLFRSAFNLIKRVQNVNQSKTEMEPILVDVATEGMRIFIKYAIADLKEKLKGDFKNSTDPFPGLIEAFRYIKNQMFDLGLFYILDDKESYLSNLISVLPKAYQKAMDSLHSDIMNFASEMLTGEENIYSNINFLLIKALRQYGESYNYGDLIKKTWNAIPKNKGVFKTSAGHTWWDI